MRQPSRGAAWYGRDCVVGEVLDAGGAAVGQRVVGGDGEDPLGAFVIGTAELVIVLNLVAKGAGVSVSTAGQLVTAYALGIAIGASIITALTMRFGRRLVLGASLAAFVAGNLLTVLATTFGLLLLVRSLTGSIHGLFIGVARWSRPEESVR